jgi:hypothetical protein
MSTLFGNAREDQKAIVDVVGILRIFSHIINNFLDYLAYSRL